jgi:hypothetical protein
MSKNMKNKQKEWHPATKPLKKKKKPEKCTFFTFTHVHQTCFAYNFFLVHFFTTFSTDSKSE